MKRKIERMLAVAGSSVLTYKIRRVDEPLESVERQPEADVRAEEQQQQKLVSMIQPFEIHRC